MTPEREAELRKLAKYYDWLDVFAALDAARDSLEMSDGCLMMIRDFLKNAGCLCGPNSHESTPPMMYPEWIACAMAKQRQSIVAERDAARADLAAAKDRGAAMEVALKRLCEPPPADESRIYLSGNYNTGLRCGVEDRDIRDRYQAAEYGHQEGVDAALEWVVSEARAALVASSGEAWRREVLEQAADHLLHNQGWTSPVRELRRLASEAGKGEQ